MAQSIQGMLESHRSVRQGNLNAILSPIALVARGRAKDLASGRRNESVLCGGRDGEARQEDTTDLGNTAGFGIS